MPSVVDVLTFVKCWTSGG